MATEEILTAQQRREVAEFTGAAHADTLDDEALLALAAEQIGMEGELAVDAGGMLELSRGPVLAILEPVDDEDAGLVEYPEQLQDEEADRG